ncbi:MAG: hypothetical protein QOE90_900 [Thermoplasmata archaeon]|jgi:hypothetical protein|nr:hypothetical protein [Thermoplasmata archaeon]
MNISPLALVALLALAGVASFVPSAGAMPPLCQSTTYGVGPIEIATVRSGAECGAYPITLYACTPKYGEAAPLHVECSVLLNA